MIHCKRMQRDKVDHPAQLKVDVITCWHKCLNVGIDKTYMSRYDSGIVKASVNSNFLKIVSSVLIPKA